MLFHHAVHVVSTQSHVHYFKNALNDLKFLLFLVIHSRMTRSSVLQPHNYVKSLSGHSHQNFILRNSWPTVVGLDRSDLALADDHNLSSWSHWQLIHGSFSLQGPERSENVSICCTLTRYCFLPTQALLLWLYLNLDITYHQNFASLCTSTSHMDTYCLSNS